MPLRLDEAKRLTYVRDWWQKHQAGLPKRDFKVWKLRSMYRLGSGAPGSRYGKQDVRTMVRTYEAKVNENIGALL